MLTFFKHKDPPQAGKYTNLLSTLRENLSSQTAALCSKVFFSSGTSDSTKSPSVPQCFRQDKSSFINLKSSQKRAIILFALKLYKNPITCPIRGRYRKSNINPRFISYRAFSEILWLFIKGKMLKSKLVNWTRVKKVYQ